MKHNNILIILISVLIIIIIGIVIFFVMKKHNEKTNMIIPDWNIESDEDEDDEDEEEWDCTSDGRCVQTKDGRYSSADVCRTNCNVTSIPSYYPQSLLYYPRRPYGWRLPPMYRHRRHRRRRFRK